MKKLEEVNPDSKSIGQALGLTETQNIMIDVFSIMGCGIKPHKAGEHPPITPENLDRFITSGNDITLRRSRLIVDTCEKYEKQGEELTPAAYVAAGIAVHTVVSNLQEEPSPRMLLNYCYCLNDLLTKLADAGIEISVE